MAEKTLNLLKIECAGRYNGSVSRMLNSQLLDHVKALHANLEIVERELCEGLPLLNDDWIGANFTIPEDREDRHLEVLALSRELIDELKTADIVLIALPIYNFGVPASLKLWIDHICQAGEGFHRTKTGPEGLIGNRRIFITVASGGTKIGSEFDFATPHLKKALNFVGITDITWIDATELNRTREVSLTRAKQQIAAISVADLLI